MTSGRSRTSFYHIVCGHANQRSIPADRRTGPVASRIASFNWQLSVSATSTRIHLVQRHPDNGPDCPVLFSPQLSDWPGHSSVLRELLSLLVSHSIWIVHAFVCVGIYGCQCSSFLFISVCFFISVLFFLPFFLGGGWWGGVWGDIFLEHIFFFWVLSGR